MSILKVDTQPLVPKRQAFPPGAGSAAEAVTKQGGPASAELASFIRNVDAWLNKIQAILQISPTIDKIAVVDKSGKVIAALGDFIFAGVPATNYFSEIHVGDPLNTGDPSQALFNANTDGTVTVGQNGSLDVLDPFGADAAWIGTQSDVFDITGAAAGAASGTVNLIRLTVVGHTLLTGDQAKVLGVVGVTTATDGTSNANGAWTVTKIDADHVDLQDSVFVGSYVSGGTISRILHVTGAADNGVGLIRLEVIAHGYETGDKVDALAVGGVPDAIGQWIITVIDADHFDLDGSTFAGAYTSGGIVLRYFAGGLFQTIAIGPSFVDYRLRAFADGTLKIKDAEIILDGTGATIVLDPTLGEIIVTQAGGGTRVTIGGPDASFGLVIDNSTGAPTDYTRIGAGSMEMNSNDLNSYQVLLDPLQGLTMGCPTTGHDRMVDLYGFTGATANGPLFSCTQLRGTGQTPTPTQAADTIGGLVAYGYDGAFETNPAASIVAVATENHGAGHGTKLVLSTTANGSSAPIVAAMLDGTGMLTVTGGIACGTSLVASLSITAGTFINAITGFKANGVAGLTQVVALAKLTALGANGSATYTGGILTAYTPPT